MLSGRSKSFILVFILFLILHIVFFNINSVEWGDSYRILRTSKHIRNLSYPEDEKRLPLYSAILATWPQGVDPVEWGKVIMLGISIVSFFVFHKLYLSVSLRRDNNLLIPLLLFSLNPVFFYWSLRIMADVTFALLVMVSFVLLSRCREGISFSRTFLIGIVVGLAALTRFEGYLLLVSVGAGVVFLDGFDFSINKIKEKIFYILSYLAGFFVILTPYFVYKNPFNSSYFQEPIGRTYDFQMVLVYAVSLLFIFGFTSAFFFYVNGFSTVKSYFSKNIGIFLFVVLELMLILLWPAAIPRLFVAILPLLIILLADLINEYFSIRDGKNQVYNSVILLLLLVFFAGFQYLLKLQFLIVVRPTFMAIILLQLFNVFSVLTRRKSLFIATLLISMLIWLVSTVWIHKDVYGTIKQASLFVKENFTGNIAYNDVNSVAEWYLDDENLVTKYLSSEHISKYSKLLTRDIDYVLLTNEHNRYLEFDVSDYDYLEEIREFRQFSNGFEFYTKVLKVKKL